MRVGTAERMVPDTTIAANRAPLVLIAPCFGNAASRRRFADTVARPVPFTESSGPGAPDR